MIVLVAKDKLILKTVSLSMQRLKRPLICLESFTEAMAFIRENTGLVESIILDGDIDHVSYECFLDGVFELDSSIRVLLYSDFPAQIDILPKDRAGHVENRIKPLILEEILDFIHYDTGRNNVVHT